MKFADVLMMDTRVVDSARVRAAVKSAHMRALKARLSRKKVPRRATFMNWLSGERFRRVDRDVARWEVRDVVVLERYRLVYGCPIEVRHAEDERR